MSVIEPAKSVASEAPVAEHRPQLRRVLGVPGLVFFGLVYMVPLTVFTTYGLAVQISGGRLAVAYAVTLAAMAFTAMSYARMAAIRPVAGSAYAYARSAFGAPTGFLAGWSLLLDYLFLPMLTYLVIGLYLNAQFPSVPAWLFVVVAILLVTVLNILGIVSVARVNVLVAVVQGVFIVVFVALGVRTVGGQGSVSLAAPFVGDGSATGVTPVLSAAAVLCLSFLGFDAVSTLAEEAKDARRTVPRAIIIVTLGLGALFIVLAYLSQLFLPDNSFSNVDTASLDVMVAVGGQFMGNAFIAVYIAAAFGGAVTAQAGVARILFAMGRDGVLPRRLLGTVLERFGTPANAIAVVAAVSLGAVWADLSLLVSVVSFGALVAFSVVNLCVAKTYFLDQPDKTASRVVSYLLLPGIGFALTVWLWTSLSATSIKVGLAWLAVGFVWLLILTRGFRRPIPTLDIE
jgi:putrescine importer